MLPPPRTSTNPRSSICSSSLLQQQQQHLRTCPSRARRSQQLQEPWSLPWSSASPPRSAASPPCRRAQHRSVAGPGRASTLPSLLLSPFSLCLSNLCCLSLFVRNQELIEQGFVSCTHRTGASCHNEWVRYPMPDLRPRSPCPDPSKPRPSQLLFYMASGLSSSPIVPNRFGV